VAIDPRRLRPSELCRLVNSTPLGTVLDERQLHRHRTRAGFRIGDGRHVDLFRYAAWLVELRHTPRRAPDGDPYEKLKERAAARNKALSLAGRDIGELPGVVNPERKAKAEQNFRSFCEAYFPMTFHLPWSPDHLKVMAKIEQAVLRGGLFAMATPRGFGKSSLCEAACIWAVLYGHREFVCLIGSDEGHAMDMLESIKMELDGNELLLEDFPEVVYPIHCLEGIANRCAGQLTALARYADLAGTQLVAQSDYTYDQAGRLRNLAHFRGQTTFVEHTWNFDAANRMTQYINSIDGTADYTSDAAGQLTAADYDYQSDESYQYDDNGNRITANGSTYTTGSNNRLLSDGTYRYLYDAEGNRTHRFIDTNQNGQLDQGDTDITQYTWDHRNRLVKVEHRPHYAAAVDKVVEYFYDHQNRWVRRAIDADGNGHLDGRRIFVYDGNQIVLDFWRNNSQDLQIGHLRQRYLWGPAVDQILAEETVDGGTADLVQWTLTDHLNTVRDIAKYDPDDDMTTVVNHLIYDAFGRVTSESNPAVDSLFLFTARPFDSDTQLQNNLNRWYDPTVGRWLSEDPIGFAAGDENLYRYVGNRIAIYADPSGLIDVPFLSDEWNRIKAEAEKRRGNGPWGDSAQHCWAACYIGALYGVGNVAAGFADLAELLDPHGDWFRDICAQHWGAKVGHDFSWLRIVTLGMLPKMSASAWCDWKCCTFSD
jgi:RHS repeat-associated protein